jgi:hypothetical protein
MLQILSIGYSQNMKKKRTGDGVPGDENRQQRLRGSIEAAALDLFEEKWHCSTRAGVMLWSRNLRGGWSVPLLAVNRLCGV